MVDRDTATPTVTTATLTMTVVAVIWFGGEYGWHLRRV
jgi:hypothetical protein